MYRCITTYIYICIYIYIYIERERERDVCVCVAFRSCCPRPLGTFNLDNARATGHSNCIVYGHTPKP